MLDFPEEWDFGWEVIKFIDGIVDWVVVNWDPFFSAINTGILQVLLPFEKFLLLIPWWFFIILIGFIAWRAASWKFGIIAVAFLIIMSFLGLYDLTMRTLAIVLAASLIGCASMRPFTDSNGKVLPNSIAKLEEVTIGGTKQWILVRGIDQNGSSRFSVTMRVSG